MTDKDKVSSLQYTVSRLRDHLNLVSLTRLERHVIEGNMDSIEVQLRSLKEKTGE